MMKASVKSIITALFIICLRFVAGDVTDESSEDAAQSQPKIFASAEQGDIKTIEDLLRHEPGLVNLQNDAGWTALTFAVANGHNDLAEVLLQHGADPNIAENDGWTPIMFAAFQDNEPLVATIMQGGGNPLHRNVEDLSAHELCNSQSHFGLANYIGEEAVYYAMANEDLFEMLRHLRQGVSANVQNNAGWTPLLFASSFGSLEAVEELVFLGAEVNAAENDGWTALMFAANNDHADVAAHLISKGAIIDAAAKDGRTALQIAQVAGAENVMKILVDAGAVIVEAQSDSATGAVSVPAVEEKVAEDKKGKAGLFGLFGG
jgi:ankyrin repeat protein